MKEKSRISRIEARFTAYQHAWSWVSEAASEHYDSDFYHWIYGAQMMDQSKLLDNTGHDVENTVLIPNEAEVALIKSEMKKLKEKLFKEMIKCNEKYNSKFNPSSQTQTE